MNNVVQTANKIYETILKESDGVIRPTVFAKVDDIEDIIPIFIVSNDNILSTCDTIWDDFEIFPPPNKKNDIIDFLCAMIAIHCQDKEMFFDVMKIKDRTRHRFQIPQGENAAEEIEYIQNYNEYFQGIKAYARNNKGEL